MQLLEALRAEHALIQKVVASLWRYVDALGAGAGAADPADGAAYVAFFRLYAGRYHHAREEDILFAALVRETEAPADRGPLRALADEHRELGALVDELEPLLSEAAPATGASARLRGLAVRYGEALLQHIAAESSVLFPEAEVRFRRVGLAELPDRAPDPEEYGAHAEGLRLLEVHPPGSVDLERGEGCVSCPSYGVRCDGLEREWWSELKWEDFFERND